MALTPDQIIRCNAAISAARAEVQRQEATYGFGYLFPSKEQRTAAAMRDTLTQIETIYAGLLDDSTPIASEVQVSEVIRNATQLAGPEFAAQMNATSTTVGDAAANLPATIADAFGGTVGIVLIVALVAGAIYLAGSVKGAAKLLPVR